MIRKTVAVIFLISVFFCFAGCVKNTEVTDNVSKPETSEIAKTPNEIRFNVNEGGKEYRLFLEEKEDKKEVIVKNSDASKELLKIDISGNDTYGDSFAYDIDVNFDGNKDILVPFTLPASAVYFNAYVYNPDTENFVPAPKFSEIPNFALDEKTKSVLGSRRASMITTYSISKYSPENKDFVITNSIYYEPTENNENYEFVETEFDKNGKSKSEKKYIVPIEKGSFDMDTNFEKLKPYYEKDSFWDLKSEKWHFEYLDLIQ